jgi:putative hydrolase of HD superfamily
MMSEMLFRFSENIVKLKENRRSGWGSHVGITNPESIADHVFGCAILAMCFGDLAKANTEKLIRMLLSHDIQEVHCSVVIVCFSLQSFY